MNVGLRPGRGRQETDLPEELVHVAETIAVHKPGTPGSDMVVPRKVFTVDLQREGYVEGYSDGSRPATAPTPPAPQRPIAGETVLGVDPARLQSLEERETALLLREVELDQREAALRDREAGPVTITSDDLGGEPVPPALQPDTAPPAPVAQPDPAAARKAARAQTERERRAKLRTTSTDQPAGAPEQEGTP